jgi:hypothetical protein
MILGVFHMANPEQPKDKNATLLESKIIWRPQNMVCKRVFASVALA